MFLNCKVRQCREANKGEIRPPILALISTHDQSG